MIGPSLGPPWADLVFHVLATLMELFNRVREGRGQVVLVAGEAGIGKSRLLLEFQRRLAATREPTTWLEGRCISFGQSSPLLPVVDQLRENFRIDEFDGEPEIIAKVEHGMRRLGGLEPHVPFVRYLLSVDPGDPAVVAMDAAQRRKRTFDAVLAMSLRGATLRPLVFVFEDLHWVDTSTEEYLAALIDNVSATRILIVATHGHAALRHAQLYTRIRSVRCRKRKPPHNRAGCSASSGFGRCDEGSGRTRPRCRALRRGSGQDLHDLIIERERRLRVETDPRRRGPGHHQRHHWRA
jgi:hypothetical protein